MPNRTTKRERAAARRRLPAACRRWGTAYTARASRTLNDAAIQLALALDDALHVKAQWEWLNAGAVRDVDALADDYDEDGHDV